MALDGNLACYECESEQIQEGVVDRCTQCNSSDIRFRFSNGKWEEKPSQETIDKVAQANKDYQDSKLKDKQKNARNLSEILIPIGILTKTLNEQTTKFNCVPTKARKEIKEAYLSAAKHFSFVNAYHIMNILTKNNSYGSIKALKALKKSYDEVFNKRKELLTSLNLDHPEYASLTETEIVFDFTAIKNDRPDLNLDWEYIY